MVLLLGASGYVGHAFASELRRREHCFIPLTRGAINYTNFELLFDYVRKMKPEFIINAAGLTGSHNVDACELAREELRNFLWRIQKYPKVYNGVHPLSHVEDFVRACFDLWEGESPYEVYNVVNPGVVTTPQVIEMIQRILKPDREFEFWKDGDDFYRHAARLPRSNCILEITKLLGTGVGMRPVEEALEESLRNWQCATPPLELVLH